MNNLGYTILDERIFLGGDYMENKRFFSIDDFSIKDSKKANKTALYNTGSTGGSVWAVQPGQSVQKHRHMTSDDIWICIKGKGLFYPDTQSAGEEIQAGMVIVTPKGEVHGMLNTGDEPFVFVSIVAPMPSDFQAVETPL